MTNKTVSITNDKKILYFENCIFGVSSDGQAFLINGPPELLQHMEGSLIEDNAYWVTTRTKWPKEPGVYKCKIRSEGIQADGKSWWDFVPENIKNCKMGLLDNETN